MVIGVASVMTSEGLSRETEGFSASLEAEVVDFDGEGFCGEVLVGEV
jgi:hypothetical protein